MALDLLQAMTQVGQTLHQLNQAQQGLDQRLKALEASRAKTD